MSTWLITGCSTGLGRALAQAVIAAGQADSVQAVFGADAEALKDNIIEIL
jgi:NAD(P)-dependent dehydrogenase (short-subunit alcohol dehydrogenase family)